MQIGLVSGFFRFMDLSDVVYIISILKPVNDLRPPNEMALLVLVAGFTFGDHFSIWTIYELKQQFPKLAPWNMHCCSVTRFQKLVVKEIRKLYALFTTAYLHYQFPRPARCLTLLVSANPIKNENKTPTQPHPRIFGCATQKVCQYQHSQQILLHVSLI